MNTDLMFAVTDYVTRITSQSVRFDFHTVLRSKRTIRRLEVGKVGKNANGWFESRMIRVDVRCNGLTHAKPQVWCF